jgi:hypothetical protein
MRYSATEKLENHLAGRAVPAAGAPNSSETGHCAGDLLPLVRSVPPIVGRMLPPAVGHGETGCYPTWDLSQLRGSVSWAELAHRTGLRKELAIARRPVHRAAEFCCCWGLPVSGRLILATPNQAQTGVRAATFPDSVRGPPQIQAHRWGEMDSNL